jgi:hypothetical protein
VWEVFQKRAKLCLWLTKRYGVKTYGKAVLYLRRLVAASGHMGFVVNKVTVGQVF